MDKPKGPRVLSLARARKRKPWQDENGNTLPDEKLKTLSRTWSTETWAEYLISIEKAQSDYHTAKYDSMLSRYDVKSSMESYWQELNSQDCEEPLKDRDWAIGKELSRLSERERQVVISIFYDGLSQIETAEALGISPPRVTQLLHRALERLKQELKSFRKP